MADTGWVIAGTGADDATVGATAWSNPGNVTADDSSNATALFVSAGQSHYIKGSNFGLAVPTGATIDGIEIRGQFSDSYANSSINYAQVEHPSSGFGNDQESGSQALTSSEVNYDYGGATELHGLSWTAANVNDSSFAVVFACSAAGLAFPACDAIWVKVYYTEAPSASDISSDGAATVSMAGVGVVESTISSDGATTVSMVGTSIVTGDISSAGSATVNMVPVLSDVGDIESIGSATVAMVGSAVAIADISSSGSSSVDFVGESVVASEISSDGSVIVDMTGASINSADIDSAGTADADMVSTTVSSADISSSASATVTMEGSSIVTADISSDGVASVDEVGASTVTADISSAGSASVDADGVTVVYADISSAGSATADADGVTVVYADISSDGSASVKMKKVIEIPPEAAGAGGGAFVNPDRLRKKYTKRKPQTHVVRIGEWPEEVEVPKKKKKSSKKISEINDQRYLDMAFDIAVDDDDEAMMLILALAA